MEKTTFGLTLYGADCRGNAKNTLYPHKYEIHSLEDFLKMADRDFVCAEYTNNRRSSVNFIGADCICMDCDNTHEVSVYSKRNREIDFRAVKDGKVYLVQVAYSVAEDKAYEREFSAFSGIDNTMKKIMITNDDMDYSTSTVFHYRLRDFLEMDEL